tara:strand:- start:27 stop:179 length:153 start_codon:yes stop_codon:yes gene_type:complete
MLVAVVGQLLLAVLAVEVLAAAVLAHFLEQLQQGLQTQVVVAVVVDLVLM